MLGMRNALIVLTIATVLGASNARAECVENIAEATKEQLLDCVTDLVARVENLERVGAAPAVGEHPETKAIVAYYADKGQLACPKGWSLYEDAKDRMIVGAGALYQYPGATGGQPEVALTEAQMPEHPHKLFATEKDTTDEFPATDNRVARGGKMDGNMTHENFEYQLRGHTRPAEYGLSSVSGGNEAHPNMPPYIALYFCKKDD